MELDSQEVGLSQTNGVLHIRFNRPDKRNAIARSMYVVMADAVARGESDDETRVVLFSGAGEGFCAGNDVNDFLSHPPKCESACCGMPEGVPSSSRFTGIAP